MLLDSTTHVLCSLNAETFRDGGATAEEAPIGTGFLLGTCLAYKTPDDENRCDNCGGVGHPKRLCPTPANSCEEATEPVEPEPDDDLGYDQGDGEDWSADYPVEICMLETDPVSNPKKRNLETMPSLPESKNRWQARLLLLTAGNCMR